MTNKILLAVIGAGLWANAAATYVRPAAAQTDGFGLIYGSLEGIRNSIDRFTLKHCN